MPSLPMPGMRAVYEHDVDYRNLQAARVIERLLGVRDDALRVLGLRRHRRHVHVEMAAVHVDGDDRGLGGLQLELAVQARDQAGAIYDVDSWFACK